ncbi:MAG TPA: hypothetical protein VK163_07590 [Opitutaceae bacterium]|nr:hypothetical protein [Opitutaceae bacterium]
MKRIALAVLATALIPVFLVAEPEPNTEEAGLRLVAFREYSILSRAYRIGDQPPSRPAYQRRIFAVLENCGITPITIPTITSQISESGGGNSRTTNFYFSSESFRQFKLVGSPVAYQPVTLAPGESTMLPIHAELVADESRERTICDYVTFHVSADLGKRNGWWTGTLTAPITQADANDGIFRTVEEWESIGKMQK